MKSFHNRTCPASAPLQPRDPSVNKRDIGTECSVYSSYLAEDDGHQEEVKQQRLGQMPMVQGEEEDGEEDGDVLVSRTAVGGAKQLQARHCDHKGADPEGGRQTCTTSAILLLYL